MKIFKIGNGNIISNSSIMQGGRTCNVNGVTIEVPEGASVSVSNGKVYINGKEYTENGLDELNVVHLTINATGDVRKVESDVNVVIEGNVFGNVEAGVNATISGNVIGDVEAGVKARIEGNQTGSVKSGVSVNIGTKIYR